MELPSSDLLEQLARDRDITVIPRYATAMGILRFNDLHPSFNNVAVRRALLGAVGQAEAMTAVAGTDRALWHDGSGRSEEPPLTARIRRRHITTTLSAVRAHRGTEGSNPFPSSGESIANWMRSIAQLGEIKMAATLQELADSRDRSISTMRRATRAA